MVKLAVLVRKEVLEQVRTRKLLIMSVVFLFVAVASPIAAKITPELLKSIAIPGLSVNLPEPTYKDSLDQFIKNIAQIALLVLVFVMAGVISDEKNKKTLEIVLTKPITRTKFILAKFVSSFISVSVIFGITCGIFYVYTVSIFSSFNFANFSLMAFIVWMYIVMIISITLLASTIVKNSIIAGGLGFLSTIFFGTILGLFEGIKIFSPGLIFSNYQEVVKSGWTDELTYSVGIMLMVIVISCFAAARLFKSQEIER